ncbi:MAG: cytochrome c [Methylobacterium sp.]|nr:cytochrome c [Methylobacterium sp.]MCA3610322.1 cytochrome c [Methylobacterium sp.]MCA3618486.1 cytochrome c [Methylobacterium sp.]MCA3622319.1 cytochrome c [Methylobacterium sp.]MCA3622781.1 cytochrome c [Methylobacterium sp.]
MSRSSKVLLGMALAVALGFTGFAQAGKTGLGRAALPAEIEAWDIDIRADGKGLPPGKGSVKDGETLFLERCAACHGEFAEGVGRWPVLAGGQGTMRNERPEKTVGSFWPDLSTAFDYIRRAMPYGNALSLTADETYAIVAFLLNMNNIVKDDFVLGRENFLSVMMPNAAAFYDDDREQAERHFWNRPPCMTNCKPDTKITGRAAVLDVTPEGGDKSIKVE